MTDILPLLVIFQLKHFLCDFPLQGMYMLGKFKGGLDWIAPLSAHCAVHAATTLVISLWWTWGSPDAWTLPLSLAAADFVIHFAQDRLKASPNLLGRFKPDNKYFWWALGQDQMVHHLTHYALIYFLVMGAAA